MKFTDEPPGRQYLLKTNRNMNLKKSKRTIKYLVVHCAATPEGRNDKAKDIDRWHRQRGWAGIGYNYVIDLDGTIEPGRDVDRIPAQVAGHNSNSIGICYIGDGRPSVYG
jgi:N-acetylmuramoyl-L-alanine amidase